MEDIVNMESYFNDHVLLDDQYSESYIFEDEEEEYDSYEEDYSTFFDEDMVDGNTFLEEVSAVSYGYMEYMEEGVGDFITGLISKVKKFFSDLAARFSAFIHKKALSERIAKAKEEISGTGIGKTKIKSIDYGKLGKLQDSTIEAIGKCTSVEQIDAVVEEYKRRRSAIMKKDAAILVSVIAIITAAGIMIKKFVKGNKANESKATGILKKLWNGFKDRRPAGKEKRAIRRLEKADKNLDKDIENMDKDPRLTHSDDEKKRKGLLSRAFTAIKFINEERRKGVQHALNAAGRISNRLKGKKTMANTRGGQQSFYLGKDGEVGY